MRRRIKKRLVPWGSKSRWLGYRTATRRRLQKIIFSTPGKMIM